jgi:hypothetical protein
MVEKHFRADRCQPGHPSCAIDSGGPDHRLRVREDVPDRVPLPRIYAAYRMPTFGSAASMRWRSRSTSLDRAVPRACIGSLVREQQVAQGRHHLRLPVIGGAAIFTIWATARPGIGREMLETALWTEVDRLTAEGPSDDELERVGNLHAAGVESSLERISERADRLSMYACLFDQPEAHQHGGDPLCGGRRGSVRDEMRKVLRPDNRVVLTYLPAESPEGAA